MTGQDTTVERWLLVAVLIAIAVLVALLTGRPRSTPSSADIGDAALYATIAADVRSGQDYYAAASKHLRANHYPVGSVFNWRPPGLTVARASVPAWVSLVVLWVLAAVLVWRSYALAGWWSVGCLMPVIWLTAIPAATWYSELWSGVLIRHSAVSFARNEPRTGAVFGVVAVMIRELAAPYCLVAGVIALWRRDWREVAVWTVGGVACLMYYAWHAQHVGAYSLTGDLVHPTWIQLGGVPFMLNAFRHATGVLVIAPALVFGVIVALAVAASWSRLMPLHVRAGVLVYAVAFLFVGQPFNGYWGLMVGPVFALWVSYAPAGLAYHVPFVTRL